MFLRLRGFSNPQAWRAGSKVTQRLAAVPLRRRPGPSPAANGRHGRSCADSPAASTQRPTARLPGAGARSCTSAADGVCACVFTFMCMCAHVYMFVCVHVHVYVRTCVHVCVCMHVRVCAFVCVHSLGALAMATPGAAFPTGCV